MAREGKIGGFLSGFLLIANVRNMHHLWFDNVLFDHKKQIQHF